jgi:hypothetical protein
MKALNEKTKQLLDDCETPLYDKNYPIEGKAGEKVLKLREEQNIIPEDWIINPSNELIEQNKPIIPVIDKVAQNRDMLIQNEIYIMNYENAEQRLINKGLIQPKEV